ncbi:bifunctional folylpolyglutamate synthase/dihydrofolate synthase [Roseivirga pacifica]|uniref:bifunctional folylpolyglutamate synthase/dihydrofolate synthase n=1 Tax=Roseivirga pacifica TaxID=1267423 RepID=UPI003BABB04E
MNYSEVLDFLYSALPMYQKVGKPAFKKDLSNTKALCKQLGNPEQKFKSIHVAGTNGKGSTSHMLAAVFQANGYKVGLYTSPHLKDFRERIKINGEMMPEEKVVGFVMKNRDFIDELKPSFFEMTVGLAFQHFAEEAVDVAIIETGLGGRLDSTNVITPEISIITNIGFDHMDMLGDTREAIAREKAGIIKPGVPVVVGESHPETDHVFRATAIDQGSDIFFSQSYQEVLTELWETDLGNPYQKANLTTAMSAVFVLKNLLNWPLDRDKSKEGLKNVVKLTNFKGRWQKLNNKPLTICDTGHNKEAFEYIVPALEELSSGRLFMVLGFVKEKKVSEILSMLPQNAYLIFCQAKIPRAFPLDELKTVVNEHGLGAEYISDVNEAIDWANTLAKPEDVIFVGGSTFVVAEIENL